jgi:hypothetical protein
VTPISRRKTREVAWAHPRSARERGHRAIAGGVVGDPALDLAQAVALGQLGRELRAEL